MFDNLPVFYRGIMLGVMVAAPVGPVGILCIRRTIQKGVLIGFASGFGAAFADAFFSALAVFGVAAVIDILKTYADPIQIFGGAFLLFVAWHTWHDKPRQPHPEEFEEKYLKGIGLKLGGALKAMATSFLITITNPATILGVLAVVATFGGLKNSMEASTITAGIFIGSSLWWLMLSGSVSFFRGHFTESRVVMMNRIMGAILALIALAAMVFGLMSFMGFDVPHI